MVIYIKNTRKQEEYFIDEFYAFIAGVIVSYICTNFILFFLKKKKEKKLKDIRGGSDGYAEAQILLECIENDKDYIINNAAIKRLISESLQRSVNANSIVVTQNLVQYLAYKKLIEEKNDKLKIFKLLIQVLDYEIFTEHNKRMAIGFTIGLPVGLLCAISGCFFNFIFLALIGYGFHDQCNTRCHQYLNVLPDQSAKEIIVHVPQETNNVVISSKKIELHVPAPGYEIPQSINSKFSTSLYEKARRQPKHMNFEQFKRQDPILRSFDQLSDPNIEIKPKKCPIKPSEIENYID